ncbi:MAG: ABC transporter permease [Bradyrhizobiaceae bacterium]|nr:ABC transporter permease [Bradyrhizobiaceae bacterium]
MRALNRKLLRDLVRMWPQALAIALVMASGAATLILGVGSHGSLAETRAIYYERNRFADVFADVTRAPNILAEEIAHIPGVAAVETRIAKIALLDIPGMAEPASAMFVSIPHLREQRLNLLHLRSGRLPIAGDEREVVVSEPFALAHKFDIGSSFEAILNGRKRTFRIVGTALSPEFIYALGPWDLMPDDRRFGIVWMSEPALAGAFDLTGAFSSVHVKLLHDASESEVIDRLDQMLTRYGGLGAYGRRDQTSHAFLDAELQQLEAMSRVLPPIFLIVAAFLVNMTLSRLISLEREQIGLLKAIGYGSWAVGVHYMQFVSVIALVGAAIGAVAGTWLGVGLTRLYGDFFHFPFLVFRMDPGVYLIAAGVTVTAAVLGALKAVRDVVGLPPAVAMTPPAPAQYRRLLLPIVYSLLRLPQTFIMAARHLLRWPVRTLSSLLGIAASVAILVGSLWSFGSVDYMIDVTFHRADRQDATINFVRERPESALWNVMNLPGVLRAEPYRSIPVKIRNGNVERRIAVVGKPPGTDLSRVLDRSLRPVRLPETGIALSVALADILKAKVGDLVEVELLERDRRRVDLPVTAIIEGYMGLMAYMDIAEANRLMHEGSMISGAHIAFDSQRQDELFQTLKETPTASFIALQRVSLQKFRDTIAENIFIMVTMYVSLAVVIAFGVVYNFARISLSEQGREIASLRVLGFTRGEVSSILLSELAVVTLLAQPLGWILGYALAALSVWAFESELYRVPLILEPYVYATGSLLVIAAAIVSGLIVRRRIDRLDLIEVLKTRE